MAPPESMRTREFWRDVVGVALERTGVVGVNFIGERAERDDMKRTMEAALPYHDVWACGIPAIAGVSDRHSLLFSTPRDGCDIGLLEKALNTMESVVDEEEAWFREVVEATAHLE